MIRNIYSNSICFNNAYIQAGIYFNYTCIRAGTCISSACIDNANIDITSIADTCARKTSTSDVFIDSTYIKSVDTEIIYISIYKSSKFSIKDLKLLIKLIFEISISFYLYLQVILDRILYCYFTY